MQPLPKSLDSIFTWIMEQTKRCFWRQNVCTIIATLLVGAFLAAYVEVTLGTLTVLSTYIRADYDSVTIGKIVKSDIWLVPGGRYGSGRYAYDIRYRYDVNGVPFEGKFVRLDNHSEPERQDAEQTVSKYPLGKVVAVHYDSRSPNYSVLENTGLSLEIPARLGLIFLVAPFIGWFLCKWFSKSQFKILR